MLLSEDSVLTWFRHYTFGQRRLDAIGKVYIYPTDHPGTDAALAQIKGNIQELGKVMTFMFWKTHSQEWNAWGVTFHSKRDLPFFDQFEIRIGQNAMMEIVAPLSSRVEASRVTFHRAWLGPVNTFSTALNSIL